MRVTAHRGSCSVVGCTLILVHMQHSEQELVPQAGSGSLCKALHCPVLSPCWIRVELLTRLFTCCIAHSGSPGSMGRSHKVPAVGRGRRSPFRAGQGASSCWDQLKPGQTLDGAQEFAIFPARILARVSAGFGHPGAFLTGKAMAVIPQPLQLVIPGETRDPLPALGSERGQRGASHHTWGQQGEAVDISCREDVCRAAHPTGDG